MSYGRLFVICSSFSNGKPKYLQEIVTDTGMTYRREWMSYGDSVITWG